MKVVYILEVLDENVEWILDSVFKTREAAAIHASKNFGEDSFYISEFEVNE